MNTNVVLNTLLTADWHLPKHYEPMPDYGTTQKGGYVKFGFMCKACATDSFRQDYRCVSEFDTSLTNLLVWADRHRHA